MSGFRLVSEFEPKGDQPQAIAALTENFAQGADHQVLLGVTGSGKTFTMANVIERLGKPTLVIAHNKTLAAQLYNEFRQFFPDNAVEYFVSYYDYYQPEAYVPATDTYIAKDASINDELDKLRHAATRSVLTRRDVVVVASVSAIFGLGSPADYHGMHIHLRRGQRMDRDELLTQLVQIQYRRNDADFRRSTFRVRGDVVEVIPAHEEEEAVRVEFFGEEVDALRAVDPLRGCVLEELEAVDIYPTSHYIAPEERFRAALRAIEEELSGRAPELEAGGKLLEAQRLKQRTLYDLEMLREVGYCPGIENYSRHLDGRAAGEPPATLMQYFPRDHLVIVDESHATIPQLRGMYNGDRSRKLTLVEHGFRLPSALDNRPLTFGEFEGCVRRGMYVSATPGPYELERSGGVVVEQLVRPTGLVDPPVEVRPVRGQVDDLLGEIRERARRRERVLVTTLTKRFAEDLTEHYEELGVRVRYMHSDIETLERVKIIRELRLGEFDVLIGINLLREGLDLPEVSLVAILDADKEGYLRSETALIQTSGRAARNVNGRVLMYAERPTRSMESAIRETTRRRERQAAYNRERGITPRSVQKSISDLLNTVWERDYVDVERVAEEPAAYAEDVEELRAEMRRAAERLEFERAAELRDRIRELERRSLGVRA